MTTLSIPPRAARPLIARRDELIAERARFAVEAQARDAQYAVAIGELDRQITHMQARHWTMRLVRWVRRLACSRSIAIPGAGAPAPGAKELSHAHD